MELIKCPESIKNNKTIFFLCLKHNNDKARHLKLPFIKVIFVSKLTKLSPYTYLNLKTIKIKNYLCQI